MFAKIGSAGLVGIEAFLVQVEVDIRMAQLPKWHMVGLPESEVKESKDRVVAAIKNSGYDFLFRKVTINLAPADVKKEGTAFDLPIALALMAACDVVPSQGLADCLFVGELGLTGELRPLKGILPMSILCREQGIKRLVVPLENVDEAAAVEGVSVFGFANLTDVVEFLAGRSKRTPFCATESRYDATTMNVDMDFSDIYGQQHAKRAIEIAAAGGHNILLSGPPGSGKTMLASRIPTILPPLTFEESLETSKIYSVMGLLTQKRLLSLRPFRDPHHSISNAGLIGGGSQPKPGEVSLAHNGVLFLDELPEFQKHVLELLRQPLESHRVTIARASMSISYPARFILVASCNPCPCGFLGHPRILCQCAPMAITRYRTRLSGPLLDRIDIKIEVPPVPYDEFRNKNKGGDTSVQVAARVQQVRKLQKQRFADKQHVYLNSQMTTKLIEKHCELDDPGEKILKSSVERFHLSGRAISRVLKVSRTIADLAECDKIKMDHVLEAIQYRNLEGAA